MHGIGGGCDVQWIGYGYRNTYLSELKLFFWPPFEIPREIMQSLVRIRFALAHVESHNLLVGAQFICWVGEMKCIYTRYIRGYSLQIGIMSSFT